MKALKRIAANIIYVFLLAFVFSSILVMELFDYHFFISQREMEALEMQTLVQMFIVPETLTPYRADIGFINNTYNSFTSSRHWDDGGPWGPFRLYVSSGDGWRLLRNFWEQLNARWIVGHHATPEHEMDYEWLNPELRDHLDWWRPRAVYARGFIDFAYYFNGLPPGEYRLIKQLEMLDNSGPRRGTIRFLDGENPRLRVVAPFTIP